jgi:YidC/Oxa1 family membrane protein insertase
VGVVILWTQLFPTAPPTPPPAAPVAGQNTPAPAPGTAPAAALAPGTPGAPGAAAGTAAAPVTNRPERLLEVSTPEVRYVFSSLGGTLVHAQLLGKQFAEDPKNQAAGGHDLVRTKDAANAPLRIAFPPPGIQTPADGAWEASQPTDPDKRGGGFFSGVSANVSSAVCFVNGSVERESIESLHKSPIQDKVGTVQWIAADEKFFLLAAVPYPEVPARPRTCGAVSTGQDLGQVTVRFEERAVAPNAETSYPFIVFAGPKVMDDLEAVQPLAAVVPGVPQSAPAEVHLEKSVDVTLAILSRPIVSLMQFFHRFTHNWGLAIVLLTLFIKVLTFYPTQKSLLSAKKMQKLAPKMAAIRKKYENDRQRQSVETMNLYKAHGVSPFGGCLPSLIQMPIWIALYSTLNYAVELYRAPFVAHIHDLTAKDPFYITPLVMGGVMYAQMKMSPAGADPQQQAMMSIMMPIMFTGFSLFLPSGLAVYMLTSYLFGILQQLYVNYLDRHGKITV